MLKFSIFGVVCALMLGDTARAQGTFTVTPAWAGNVEARFSVTDKRMEKMESKLDAIADKVTALILRDRENPVKVAEAMALNRRIEIEASGGVHTPARRFRATDGRWYTEKADGTCAECTECNAGLPAIVATVGGPRGHCPCDVQSGAPCPCPAGNCGSLACPTAGVGLSGGCGSAPRAFAGCGASSQCAGASGGGCGIASRPILGAPFRLLRGIFGGCGR